MKRSVSFLFFVFCTVPSLTSSAGHTIFSNLSIPKQFESDYLEGVRTFNRSLEKGVQTPSSYYDGEASRIPSEEGRFFFSMGVFDAKFLFQQRLLLEYMLELRSAEAMPAKDLHIWSIKELFKERLRQASLDQGMLQRLNGENPLLKAVLPAFISEIKRQAKNEGRAFIFGRFIFTSSGSVYTLFEYDVDYYGFIRVDEKGAPKLLPGSYQKTVERLTGQAKKLATDYFNWKPSIFFGEDSLWRGFVWRNRDELSLREVKEEEAIDEISSLIRWAKDLDLNTTSLIHLKMEMLKKQRAYYSRDAEAFNKVQWGVAFAPAIPLGIYVGASGLHCVGLKSVGVASGTYVGASLAYAANVSSLVSLSTMAIFAGLGVKNAIEDAKASDSPFLLSHAADQIVGAMVQSFPLSAILPAAVGTTVTGAKYIVVTVQAMIANGFQMGQAIRTMGARGFLHAFPKLTGKVFHTWATAWWKNKILILEHTLETTVWIVAEIVSRESQGGEHAFFLQDEEGRIFINPQSKITMTSGFIVSTIQKPFMAIFRTNGGYVLTSFVIGLTGHTIAQKIATGNIDERRFTFDVISGFTIAAAYNRLNQKVTLSEFIGRKSFFAQCALLSLWKVGSTIGYASFRNALLDAYVTRREDPYAKLKEVAKEELAVDLDKVEEQDIRASLEMYFGEKQGS